MTDNITLPREVVQNALDALVWEAGLTPTMYSAKTGRAITALRTHLAAPRLDVTVDPRLTPEEAAAISLAIDARKKERSEENEALRRENERLSATVKAREDEILTHSEAVYEATRLLSEEREKNERLREAAKELLAAYSSPGGATFGHIPRPATREHEKRIDAAWKNLEAALRREDV